MSGNIFLIQGNYQLVEMKEAFYDSEALLQELLENYPNLLAGDQINSDAPRKWLLLKREREVPAEKDGAGRWLLDHLFVDQDGIPTLVEVKRSTDTRIRREVVGQMLDYAANAVVYWSIEEIIAQFKDNCQVKGEDTEEILREFLGIDAEEINTFWEKVETNLREGKVRLLFVADEIPSELKLIIEFLNKQMKYAEVLGVEIKQYIGDDNLKILVPRVIGQLEEAKKGKVSSQKRQWDEVSFFQELAQRQNTDEIRVVREIFNWAQAKNTNIFWGTGTKEGSLIPKLKVGVQKKDDYPLFYIYTGGKINITLVNSYQTLWEELHSRLSHLVNKKQKDYFVIDLSQLTNGANLKLFTDTFEWLIEELNKY